MAKARLCGFDDFFFFPLGWFMGFVLELLPGI